MSDIRNTHLEKIIATIFPMKRTMLDSKKKKVIIGDGKYANKCSFLETDKEYYINLLKYTFIIDGTEFVDKNLKCYSNYNRLIAVDNALKYLKENDIVIKCNLYCDSERTLLAGYIFKIFEELLSEMFSFGKNFDAKKYEKKFNEIFKRYRREIITKGIITVIYENANWSDVEVYKESDSAEDCLLIDNGFDWRGYNDIRYINTGLKLQIKSALNSRSCSIIEVQYDKIYNLQDKIISVMDESICYLDFFHLDHYYYLPNKFCYCTNIESDVVVEKTILWDNVEEDTRPQVTYDQPTNEHKNKSIKFSRATEYLRKTYCIDRMQQYMNTFSIIADILDVLLRIKFKDFYSDEFNFSETSFSIGFKQLTYFLKDNRINYTKKEINAIYKYLITKWFDTLRFCLDFYNFEEMFKIYSDNENYKQSIEKSRKKIDKYKSLKVLDEAFGFYKKFYDRNCQTIQSFEKKVSVEYYESIEQLIARVFNTEYDQFKILKKSIENFKRKLNWEVPYYVRITVDYGHTEHKYVDEFQGYGHVGEKKQIKHIQDEHFEVEGPEYIKLGFGDNVAEVRYTLKAEYVKEKTKRTIPHNTIKNTDAGVMLKKNRKYHIEFEAHGNSRAPFSFIIIRRNINNKSFETIFDKSDIELSSTFKKYTFEFTYNEENDDLCYLVFGYGKLIEEYEVKNIKVSEIE